MNTEHYQARRKALLKSMPEDSVALLFAAPVRYRNRDVEYPYRQDSDFLYLTGFEEPEAVLVLRKRAEESASILFLRPKDPIKECWDGQRLGPEAALESLGVDQAHDIQQIDSQMPGLLKGISRIYHTSESRVRESLARWFEEEKDGRREASTRTEEGVASLVHPMRLIKSPEELALMRQAADITCQAHVQAMRAAKPGEHEYVLEAALLETFYRHGSRFPAYPSIVGAGNNACTLHYTDNNAPMADKTLVLIDAGCEYAGYAADVTRTFPVNGKFTEEQKALYALVLDAQEAGIAAVAPNKPFTGVQEAILKVLVPGLVSLGILKGDPQQLMDEKGYLSVYMHGSGHWLGLDVHDVGLYYTDTDKKNSQTFIPGMVLTVEPGVYIAQSNTQVPEKWRGIGIRIEDDILVTENGSENLTAALPKTVDGIEQLMAAR